MPILPGLAVAIAFGIGAAAYFGMERLGRGGAGLAFLRGSSGALLAFLLLDLTCPRLGPASRPLVLLDGSLSMDAAGGHGAAARDSAVRWGDVRYFGADSTRRDSLPGYGRSVLRPALIAALAQDRPVIVATDGALEDGADLPADLLARTSIRLFLRDTIPDAAVLRVDAPAQASLGDTLPIEVAFAASGGITPHGTVEILDARGTMLQTRPVTFTAGEGRLQLELPTRALGAGDHLLSARVVARGDAEPRDDAREFLVKVTPLPGAVLLAAPPDWDARALYATLRDVAALPVKGFVRLGPAGWRTIDGLRRVPADEVARVARGAALLVVKGAPEVIPAGVHPRAIWRWSSGEGGESVLEGDWYAAPAPGVSPLAGALGLVSTDSLPPLLHLIPVEPAPGGWVALTATLGRRGAPRPLLMGRDSAGMRVLTVTGDGLWRWAFRPGAGEEAYREIVAASVDWLLGASDTVTGIARPLRPVVPLGAPILFARTDTATLGPTLLTLTGDSATRTDTVTFDGTGRAEVRLPPGRYGYRFARGGAGVVVVDRWSAEFVPRGAGLGSRDAGPQAAIARTVLRDAWWMYALIVALLAAEWWLRRRAGLR